MEPNLKDIDDYDKPLKNSKFKNILIAFVILLSLFGISAFIQSSM